MARKAAAIHCMLRVHTPGRADRVEDLLGKRYVIGRGDPEGRIHVDFALPGDPHLSRAHCHLDRAGESYAIENLSPNGTLVNGRAIEEPVPLKHKDRIEIGGDTVLEFLHLTDAERARELKGAAPAAGQVEAAPEEKRKSFLQSPWMWGILGFYGLLALVVVSAVSSKSRRVEDPGAGPYFEDILAANLEPPAENTGARALADRMWAEALRRHGGESLTRGPHAYYLVREAQRVLALLGFPSLREAIRRKDPVAVAAGDALSELEARVSNLYREARQLREAGHRARARRLYERIRDAIPDRDVPLRRYAVHMAERLGRKK